MAKEKLCSLIEKDKERLQKQMLFRQLQRKYNKLLKEQVLQDELLDLLKNEIRALPATRIPKKKRVDRDVTKEECLLLLGDIHIGEVVSLEEMGGFGKYGIDVFVSRMEYLFEKIVDLAEQKLQGYNFQKLNVVGLGDMVSGMIHEELVETAEGTVIEWTLGGALVTAQFLMDLSRHFPKVEFTGVVGNHGRMNKKPRFKHRYVNWDYLYYQTISLMCANQKNIIFDLPKCFFRFKEIAGQNYLILHGDNINMYRSIPWYGISRSVDELQQLLSGQGKIFQNVLLGHFHNGATLNKVVGEIILNGSMIGGNEFSLGRMFRSSDPMQLLLGVNSKYGVTWRFPINLKNAQVKDTPRYKFQATNLAEEVQIMNSVK